VFAQPSKPTIAFLTVCTKDRRPWLATDAVHALLREVWADSSAWLVGRYVLMPDHVHLFAAPGGAGIIFDNWVKYWKSQFSKRHQDPNHRWQTDHFDRRLRDGENYAEKWEYVRQNPVRHKLARAEDWPYQGELNALPW
jgi:putative transposase